MTSELLKEKFSTGSIPTGEDFALLIDTLDDSENIEIIHGNQVLLNEKVEEVEGNIANFKEDVNLSTTSANESISALQESMGLTESKLSLVEEKTLTLEEKTADRGVNLVSTGLYSKAEGLNSVAEGKLSTVIGVDLLAEGVGDFALGQGNKIVNNPYPLSVTKAGRYMFGERVSNIVEVEQEDGTIKKVTEYDVEYREIDGFEVPSGRTYMYRIGDNVKVNGVDVVVKKSGVRGYTKDENGAIVQNAEYAIEVEGDLSSINSTQPALVESFYKTFAFTTGKNNFVQGVGGTALGESGISLAAGTFLDFSKVDSKTLKVLGRKYDFSSSYSLSDSHKGRKLLISCKSIGVLAYTIESVDVELSQLTLDKDIEAKDIIEVLLLDVGTLHWTGSITEGVSNIARGKGSHAEGYSNVVGGNYSHVEGSGNVVAGEGSHAEGSGNVVTGKGSHAEGSSNKVSGASSHAEGFKNTALGSTTHAEGTENVVVSTSSHVEGMSNLVYEHSSIYKVTSFNYSTGEIVLENIPFLSALSTNTYHDRPIALEASDGKKYSAKILKVNNNTVTINPKDVVNTTFKNLFFYKNSEDASRATLGSHAEGSKNIVLGSASHVEGESNLVSTKGSHVEGLMNKEIKDVNGYGNHVEGGSNTILDGIYAHVEGASNFASGTASHVEGSFSEAFLSGHAEGNRTIASGSGSHAGGFETVASGLGSYAEGEGTVAKSGGANIRLHSVDASTKTIRMLAKDYKTYFKNGLQVILYGDGKQGVKGVPAKIVGSKTILEEGGTNVEFYDLTIEENGIASSKLTVDHIYMIPEGYSLGASHAEGKYTRALGANSHAEGFKSVAEGDYSHAQNEGTVSNVYASTSIGLYNKELVGNLNSRSTDGDLFAIGNGTSSARNNAFRVSMNGSVYGMGEYNTTGADYAEYFEWKDGNPKNEDRRGFFVTLDGEHIRKATSEDDYILGIVSANPSVVGDSYQDDWSGKYLKDDWGNILTEEVEVDFNTIDEDGNHVVEKIVETVMKVNPSWNIENVYIPRKDRQEWDAIGLVGKLLVIDDGKTNVGDFVTANDNGVATKSDKGYRVMKRINKNLIQVLVK